MHHRGARQPQTACETGEVDAAAAATPTAGALEACFGFLLVGPVQQGGDELQDLEFFGVGAVEGEEMEEVVGDDLSVGVLVLGT